LSDGCINNQERHYHTEINNTQLNNKNKNKTQKNMTPKCIPVMMLIGLLVLASWDGELRADLSATKSLKQQALDAQNNFLIQDQNRLRFDELQRDEFLQKKRHQDQATDWSGSEQMQTPPKIGGDLPSFLISQIQLEGVTALSWLTVRQMKAPYLNRKLSMNDINRLVHELTNTYVKKGYITTRVYIPKQNLNAGTLTLIIQEGRVEAIEKIGVSRSWNIFPSLKNKVLNIRDIEQGLDQLNRLYANSVTVALVPSEQTPGSSIVRIENRKRSPGSSRIRYDTISQTQLGVLPNSIDLSYDNFLGIHEQWRLNYSQRFSKQTQYNNSYSVSVSVPFRYSTFQASYSQFDYLIILNGISRQFNSTGTTTSLNLGMDRLMYRNAMGKIKGVGGLKITDTVSFIEDVKSDIGSRKLVVMNVGSDIQFQRNPIGVISMGAVYYRGISRWNATRNNPLGNPSTPKAQFQKLTAYLNWNFPFRIRTLPIQLHAQSRGQYSPHTLFAAERMGIGDFSSVRGYDATLQGDSGAQFSLSARYPIMGRVALFHAVDAGVVYQTGGQTYHGALWRGAMIGAATGIEMGYQLMSLSLTIARGLKASYYMTTPPYVVYMSVTTQFM
jgi:hemolysin activation/secretion protein